MSNPESLLQRLIQHQVEFVVVGGYAAVAHGATMVTFDLDICCHFTAANLQRLAGALADLHPTHRLTPERLPLVLTPELLTSLKNLYLETDWGVLDCLSSILGLGDFDAVKPQTVNIAVAEGFCLVLNLDALIKAKEAMHRPHDQLAVLQLKAIRERLP